MGWTIMIGQGALELPEPGEGSALRFTVKKTRSSKAPVLVGDSTTGDSNMRSPSYTQWHAFVEAAGIADWFCDPEDGLMPKGGGQASRITKDHVEKLQAAYKRWKETHPGLIEGWAPENEHLSAENKDNPAYDPVGARLHWMLFWCTKAFNDYNVPVFLAQ